MASYTSSAVRFGQMVIGPPGSGKSTYCKAMAEILGKLGRRTGLVNVDPANENLPFEPIVDVSDLIQLFEVMENLSLGPNGGLIYCMEFLEKNIDWLLEKLKSLPADTYLIFDCPGQVELYTHNNSMKRVIKRLESELDLRLCAVHLVDSHYCSDPSKFIAVCLTSLCTMLQLELPHVNILSKADLIEKHGRLDFNVDFYTEVLNLEYLIECISDDPFTSKFKKLNEALTDLLSNYSLVNFMACSVKSRKSLLTVRNAIDKANGYCFSSKEEAAVNRVMAFVHDDFEYAKTMEIRENFMQDLASDQEEVVAEGEKLGNDLDLVDLEPGFQI